MVVVRASLVMDEVHQVVPDNVLHLHDVYPYPNQEEAPRSKKCPL